MKCKIQKYLIKNIINLKIQFFIIRHLYKIKIMRSNCIL